MNRNDLRNIYPFHIPYKTVQEHFRDMEKYIQDHPIDTNRAIPGIEVMEFDNMVELCNACEW